MARQRLGMVTLLAASVFASLFASRSAIAATPLTTINGTVSDNAGGSGVAKVDAYLIRSSGGVDQYWAKRSGTWGWDTSVTAIPTTIASSAWSVTPSSPAGTSFPSGANWIDGAYRVQATAYDIAGNSATSTVNTFTVDSTGPSSVAVLTPSNSSGLKTFTSITGTASDTEGGSGIAKVDVYLRRKTGATTYEFWGNRSGTWSWAAASVAIPATVTGGTWKVQNGSPTGTVFPTGANLIDGTYLVYATGFDKAGNSLTSATNTFSLDTVLPLTAVVTTPATATTVKTLPQINGTATDNVGGTGIATVDVYLRRKVGATYEFWGPRAGAYGWAADQVALPTAVTGTTWKVLNGTPAGTVMPSGATLLDGGYLVYVRAYDKSGNYITSSTNSFNVDSGAPTSATVIAPANGATVKTFTVINGTATDNEGGTGIAKVDVTLRRKPTPSTTEYWGNRSGTWGWGADVLTFPAAVTGTTWKVQNATPAGTLLPSGANLTNTTYIVGVKAWDKSNLYALSANNTFVVDNAGPLTATVTTPANLAGVKTLPIINGTATDNVGGSGIAKVDVTLRHQLTASTYEYWGSRSGVYGWGTDVITLPATVTGTTWKLLNASPAGTILPAGASLVDGTYLVGVKAWDYSNLYVLSAVNTFTVDNAVPITASVTTPANLSGLKTFTVITGQAVDNTGGSGIAKVDVTLRRQVSAGVFQYWGNRGGTYGWASDNVVLPASLSGTTWKVINGTPAGTLLPTGADLPDATYLVHCRAYDKVGNYATSSTNSFVVDNVNPVSAAITTPSNGSIISALPQISGTASDNLGGGGIIRVDVFLRRAVSGGGYEYWALRAGTWGWAAASASFAATPTGTTWSVSNGAPAGTQLPAGANLLNGSYLAHVRAYDKSSNYVTSPTISFMVNNAPARVAATPSPIVLSAASADSARSSVTLVYTGAVSTATATNVANYVVSVNGVATTFESAASNGVGNVVTLGFGDATLQAGDQVTVKYDLLDNQGRTIAGQTNVVSN